MARNLTATEAKIAFEELVQGLAKQHLRLQFRRKFGAGAAAAESETVEPIDAAILIKSATVVPLDRPISNLLQESPEKLQVVRLIGTAEAMKGEAVEAPGNATFEQIVAAFKVEQGFSILGRKARLFAYFDPADGNIYSARQVVELVEEKKAPQAKPRTRARARTAGKAVATRAPRATKPHRGKGRR